MTTVWQKQSQTLIIRRWQEQSDNHALIRYRIENPRTSEVWHFHDLSTLLTFLTDFFANNTP